MKLYKLTIIGALSLFFVSCSSKWSNIQKNEIVKLCQITSQLSKRTCECQVDVISKEFTYEEYQKGLNGSPSDNPNLSKRMENIIENLETCR